jgi:hypothetical protein
MDTITTKVFSGCRVLYILAVFALVISLFACASGPETQEEEPAEVTKEEEPGKGTGSLSRTFTIVDEQGRNSGSLTLDPSGNAVLRDENGSVIGSFKPTSPAESQPAKVQPAEAQPTEAQPDEAQPDEVQPDKIQPDEAQPAEVQPAEAQPAEAQPETPTTQ